MPNLFRFTTKMTSRVIKEMPRFIATAQNIQVTPGATAAWIASNSKKNGPVKLTGGSVRYTHTLFSPTKNYSPEVAAKIGALKRTAKFQHNVKDSTQIGLGLIRESQLFSKLILACSAYNGLSKTQHQFTFNSIRYYNGAPLDGSKDTANIRETIAGCNDYYLNDKKKSSVEEINSIVASLAALTPDIERQLILKRSALFVAIQIMAFDRPFSELDRIWSKKAAQILNISEEEENSLVALSLLDHQYTPLGPKPAVSHPEFEQVILKLNAIEHEFNSFYDSFSNNARCS